MQASPALANNITAQIEDLLLEHSTQPSNPRRSDPEIWYGRLVLLTFEDFTLPEASRHYLTRPPRQFLVVPAVDGPAGATTNNIFAKHVSYMLALKTFSAHHNILYNISCMFFYAASSGNLATWNLRYRDAISLKLCNLDILYLFTLMHPTSPPPTHTNRDYNTFASQI
ncbi:hypothetical protein M3J09_013883 [Ascochyta lentis]